MCKRRGGGESWASVCSPYHRSILHTTQRIMTIAFDLKDMLLYLLQSRYSQRAASSSTALTLLSDQFSTPLHRQKPQTIQCATLKTDLLPPRFQFSYLVHQRLSHLPIVCRMQKDSVQLLSYLVTFLLPDVRIFWQEEIQSFLLRKASNH
ncbi:hypothetical protein BC835DRAFT_290571 [Cytidiella melzeri]|nr:hypothetical protein BC835DRAFT_290571 [Cytidiella melzeri]